MKAIELDLVISELGWFFRDSDFDSQIALTLAAMSWSGDLELVPADRFDPVVIARHRRIRGVLLGLEGQHADVLGWMFEQRAWHPRILSTWSWPGVAVRTLAARYALALAELDAQGLPSGDHRGGMEGFLVGLSHRPKSPTIEAIRSETSRRVGEALAAYRVARRALPRRRATG